MPKMAESAGGKLFKSVIYMIGKSKRDENDEI